MGKFGNTAVRAVELLHLGCPTAEEAWSKAAAEVFSGAPASRAKTCPREAFLGLVQQGFVVDVEPSRCTPVIDGKNRAYSSVAATMLAHDPELASASKADLWHRVMLRVGADPKKQHNEQLDVVKNLHAQRLLSVP